ncbi:MAG: hypothetical protein K6F65_05950 [Lachnospiraceae bacterium]|nr:hypothetical protein [Lachnospiraceae bacterium]
MKRHTISYVSFLLCQIFVLGACSDNVSISGRSMEPVAVLDFTVPSSAPNIMSDLGGYSLNSEKYAYLRINENAGPVEAFRIVDMESEQTAFEGVFLQAKNNSSLLVADFSDLKEEGYYRVECETYGCSEVFRISGDLYGRLSEDAKTHIMEGCRDLSADPQTVLDYLQTYEWFGEILSDTGEDAGTDVISGAPDELICVRDWISGRDYEGSVGTEAVIYSAILAKFSFLYRNYDSALATECLQKASSIYSQSGNVVRSDSATFRALAELYRASGESTYEAGLAGYKEYFSSGDVHPDEGYMYGAMTYIVTRQTVDKELCDMLVDSILADAQSINNRKREITDPMYSQTGGSDEMIGYIRTLMCANYILKGYEYDRTMQMMLHYLSGLNVESSAYEPEAGSEGVYYLIYSCMAALEKEGKL